MSDKKIALITGANKGIGFETAKQLAQQGVKVILGARDAGRGSEATAKLRAEGLDAESLLIDVTNEGSIKLAAAQVTEKFGKLDILINNAGVGSFTNSASEESDSDWRHIFDTNVFGLVNTTQSLLPLLKKSVAGRIVHLTSILGSLTLASDPKSPIGPNTGHGAAYGASKSAVNMFTVHLARELANTAIKVNAAHPGWVKTELGGEGAPMEISDGAKTSVQLALLPDDGPNGGFFHLGQTLPW